MSIQNGRATWRDSSSDSAWSRIEKNGFGPGGGTGANERTVDVQINRLRRKIEIDPANPVYLQTVRGVGYRLLVD